MFINCLNKSDQQHISDLILSPVSQCSDTDEQTRLDRNITYLRTNLTSIIDVDNGLLDELCRHCALNGDQVEAIKNEDTHERRASMLTNEIIHMPGHQLETLLQLLCKTQQQHVANYIRANGDLRSLGEFQKPLHICDEWQVILNNWNELIEALDFRCGLLDAMLSAGCIHDRLKDKIESQKEELLKKERCLQMLERRSMYDYKKFINCLVKTKQRAVLSLLPHEPADLASITPFTHEQQYQLNAIGDELMRLIDIQNVPMVEWLVAGCITKRQKEFIEAAQTRSDGNRRLLNIIKRYN